MSKASLKIHKIKRTITLYQIINTVEQKPHYISKACEQRPHAVVEMATGDVCVETIEEWRPATEAETAILDAPSKRIEPDV